MASYSEWDRLVNLFRASSKSPNIAKAFDEAKKHSVRQDVEMTALSALVSALTPPAGGLVFGADLPARLPESTGSVTNVSTAAGLSSAIGSVANGSIINITANIDGAGGTLTVSRDATALAPITVTSDPGVLITNYSQILLQGSYFRFRDLDVGSAVINGFKVDLDGNNFEIDHCHVHHCALVSSGIGILVSGSANNVQIWNCEINNNGSTSNLNHGIYLNQGIGETVIANNLVYDNWAYNVQLYPDVQDLIYTCNTIDGGNAAGGNRGGTILGSEGVATTGDNTIVGYIGTNAPGTWGFRVNDPLATGNVAFDSLGFGNASGDFDPATNITYTNCTNGDPLYVDRGAKDFHLQSGSPAKSKIQPAQYGYVPPLDRDGNPRITADAGCYRAP